MTTPLHRTAPLALILALSATTHAQNTQNIRVIAKPTPGGVGLSVGLTPVTVNCLNDGIQIQLPAKAPKPPIAGGDKPSHITSLILTQKSVLRIVRKTQAVPTANLNPLELQLTCIQGKVTMQAGSMINLIQK